MDIRTLLEYKKALRADDYIENGKNIKPKEMTVAQQLVQNLSKQELNRILAMLDTKAFVDICDLLRIINAIEGKERIYDHFPEDFYKLLKQIKHLLK